MSRSPRSPQHRSPGEGSISQRTDGRWCGALMVNGKRTYVYGRTRAEAVDKLRRLSDQARHSGRLPDPGTLTLGAFLHAWLDQAATRLRPGSYATYETLARLHVLHYLANVKLSRLQPLHVVRLQADLARSGRGTRRRQMVRSFLHTALGDAVRWGLLTTNPVAQVDAPRHEPKEPALWTPEQTAAFVGAVLEGQGGQYGYLFVFLLATGVRAGEARGLCPEDVDGPAGTVRIARQVTFVRNRPVDLPPKSRSGKRTISLPAWGLEALKRQRALGAAWRLKAGAAWLGGTRIFTAETGAPPKASTLRRSLHRLAARLGLPPLRIHDLRHISLSLLAMAGVPVKVAQERAGHSTPSVTLRVYTHVLGDGDRAAAAALDVLHPGPAAEGSIKM
ncbi:MAG: site-specific integrase [Chloroflexi bacterium]|nr:site-specific integrase [Chloroflexota bacterium]